MFSALTINATLTPDTICASSPVQLFSGAGGGSGGYSASWTSSPASFTSNLLNPIANPTVSTTYYLALSSLSCQQFDTVSVTVNPLPPTVVITAGGPTSFCQVGSVLLSGNTIGGIWNAGGSTSDTLLVTTAGDYFVTTSNACGTTTSNVITVTVDQPPVAAIITFGSATTFCSGSSVLLSGNNTNGTWSVVGGNSLTLSANSTGDYFVTNTNSCGSVTSNHISVTVLPTPVFSLQPSNQLLSIGATAQFIAVPSFTALEQWQQNTGAGFTDLIDGGQYSGVTTNILSISSVTASQNYFSFRCIVTEGICADTSDIAFLLIATGINELMNENSFKIYPNPSNGFFSTFRILKSLG